MEISTAATPSVLLLRRYGPDLILAACVTGITILNRLVSLDELKPGHLGPSSLWQWGLLLLPGMAVAFRRRAPLVATLISVVAQMAVWIIGLASLFVAPLILIYTSAADAGKPGRRVAVGSGAALSLTALAGVFFAPDVTIDLLVLTAFTSIAAYMLGVNAANQKETASSLAAELAVAEVERENERQRAAVAERQHITRELHDIVGHSLSVIAVRAEAADRVSPKNPQAAVDAVGPIAATARSSLAEVRRVLTGLRSSDAQAELEPLPSLGSLPGLIQSTRDAGFTVEVIGSLPDDNAVGHAVGVGTYRIAQEAITNVIKHGGQGCKIEMTVDIKGNELRMQIDDDGRGMTSAPQSGSGLTGMKERADVLGGTLTTGPRPGGGFRVVVTLPIDEAAATTDREIRR